jgi:hypothetical protein
VGDLLLFVEHPHVLTLGVRGDGGRSHILATAEALAAPRHRGPRNGRAAATSPITAPADRRLPIVDLKPIAATFTATCAISRTC